MWQSAALAGALSLGGPAPTEFGTCWASLWPTWIPEAVAVIAATEAPLDEGATCDHFFLPSCLKSTRLHTRPSARKGRHVRLQLRRSTGILAFANVNCLAHRRKGFCMSVVSPHQTIAAEA